MGEGVGKELEGGGDEWEWGRSGKERGEELEGNGGGSGKGVGCEEMLFFNS